MRGMRHLAIAAALVRFYVRAVPGTWYRQAPFLPVPPRKYLEWRFQTAYGSTWPAIGVVLGDLWQFGEWLADAERAGTGSGSRR